MGNWFLFVAMVVSLLMTPTARCFDHVPFYAASVWCPPDCHTNLPCRMSLFELNDNMEAIDDSGLDFMFESLCVANQIVPAKLFLGSPDWSKTYLTVTRFDKHNSILLLDVFDRGNQRSLRIKMSKTRHKVFGNCGLLDDYVILYSAGGDFVVDTATPNKKILNCRMHVVKNFQQLWKSNNKQAVAITKPRLPLPNCSGDIVRATTLLNENYVSLCWNDSDSSFTAFNGSVEVTSDNLSDIITGKITEVQHSQPYLFLKEDREFRAAVLFNELWDLKEMHLNVSLIFPVDGKFVWPVGEDDLSTATPEEEPFNSTQTETEMRDIKISESFENEKGDGWSTEWIVGITLGFIAFLAVIAFCCIMLLRCAKNDFGNVGGWFDGT